MASGWRSGSDGRGERILPGYSSSASSAAARAAPSVSTGR